MADISRIERTLRKRLLHPIEALASYAAFGLLKLLPLDLASALGGLLGRAIGPRLKVTATARRNLRRAFPEKNDAEIEAIIPAMWENIGRTAFEFPFLHRLRMYGGGAGDHVEVVGAEIIDALRQ